MYERFSDRARDVIRLAEKSARDLNHEYIGVEHLLLGLAMEEDGVASRILQQLEVTGRWLVNEVSSRVRCNPCPIGEGKLPLTPRARLCLEYAQEESRLDSSNYVGTEHILLGLFRDSEGLAAEVFRHMGLTQEEVRDAIYKVHGTVPEVQSQPITKKDESESCPS